MFVCEEWHKYVAARKQYTWSRYLLEERVFFSLLLLLFERDARLRDKYRGYNKISHHHARQPQKKGAGEDEGREKAGWSLHRGGGNFARATSLVHPERLRCGPQKSWRRASDVSTDDVAQKERADGPVSFERTRSMRYAYQVPDLVVLRL